MLNILVKLKAVFPNSNFPYNLGSSVDPKNLASVLIKNILDLDPQGTPAKKIFKQQN